MIHLAPPPPTPAADPAALLASAPDAGADVGLSFAETLDRASDAAAAQDPPATPALRVPTEKPESTATDDGAASTETSETPENAESADPPPPSDAPAQPSPPTQLSHPTALPTQPLPSAPDGQSSASDAPDAEPTDDAPDAPAGTRDARQPRAEAPTSRVALAVDALNHLTVVSRPSATTAQQPATPGAPAAQESTADTPEDQPTRVRTKPNFPRRRSLLDFLPRQFPTPRHDAAPPTPVPDSPAFFAASDVPTQPPAPATQPTTTNTTTVPSPDTPHTNPNSTTTAAHATSTTSTASTSHAGAHASQRTDTQPARPAAQQSPVVRLITVPAHPGAGGQPGHGQAFLNHAAAPATPTPATTAQQDLLAAQMSRIIAASASRSGDGSDTITMRLTPETLGAMTIRVDLRDGALSASFATQTAQARDLLESSMPLLRSALEARGLSIERLAVELTPATPPQSDSPDRHAAERQHHNDASGGSADGRGDRHPRDGSRGHNTDDARAGTDADAGATSHASRTHIPPPLTIPRDRPLHETLLLGIDALA